MAKCNQLTPLPFKGLTDWLLKRFFIDSLIVTLLFGQLFCLFVSVQLPVCVLCWRMLWIREEAARSCAASRCDHTFPRHWSCAPVHCSLRANGGRQGWRSWTQGNNNNNNNTTTIFMVLSSWRSAIARVHPVHNYDECRLSARWPPTLRPSHSTWAVSLPIGCYHPHPPSPFYYYSAQRLILILPSHGG